MFSNKKNPKIKFYSSRPGLEDIAPIVPLSKSMPEWFKTCDTGESSTEIKNYSIISNSNIKKCPGIFDYFSNLWVIPMWCDLYIKVQEGKSIEWKSSDDTYSFEIHPHSQFIDKIPNTENPTYYWVLKCVSPWTIKTTNGYSILMLNAFYHFNSFFDHANGVLNSDCYHNLNNQLIIKRNGEFVIKKGTPLCYIMPYKREKIEGGMIKNYKKSRILSYVSNLKICSKFSSATAYKNILNKKCPFS